MKNNSKVTCMVHVKYRYHPASHWPEKRILTQPYMYNVHRVYPYLIWLHKPRHCGTCDGVTFVYGMQYGLSSETGLYMTT